MRNYIERRRRSEKGFTLIELLVVIVILGILAAVVVFAVGGLNDKGDTSACKIDTRTIKTAQEAFFARTPTGGQYAADEAALVAAKLLDQPSTLHNTTGVDTNADGTLDDYTVTVEDTSGSAGADKCGLAPADVDDSGTDANI